MSFSQLIIHAAFDAQSNIIHLHFDYVFFISKMQNAQWMHRQSKGHTPKSANWCSLSPSKLLTKVTVRPPTINTRFAEPSTSMMLREIMRLLRVVHDKSTAKQTELRCTQNPHTHTRWGHFSIDKVTSICVIHSLQFSKRRARRKMLKPSAWARGVPCLVTGVWRRETGLYDLVPVWFFFSVIHNHYLVDNK